MNYFCCYIFDKLSSALLNTVSLGVFMQFYILGYSTVCDLHYNNIHILFRCKVLYLVLKRSCVFKRFVCI